MPMDVSLVGEQVFGVEKTPGSVAELSLQKVETDNIPERLAEDAANPKGSQPRPLGVGLKLDVFA